MKYWVSPEVRNWLPSTNNSVGLSLKNSRVDRWASSDWKAIQVFLDTNTTDEQLLSLRRKLSMM